MPSERHILRKILIAIAAAVLLLTLCAAWLLASEGGAHAVLSATVKEPVQLHGVHGRLIGPLQIDRITIDSPASRIDLEQVELDWQPSALLHGLLHVTRLHAAKLSYTARIEQKSEPRKLPDTLDLPLALQFDSIDLGSGAIAWGPLDIIRLGAAEFGLAFDHARYQFQLKRFSAQSDTSGKSFGGKLTGEAMLSTAKPYALRADFTSDAGAAFGERKFASNGRIHVEGTLAELAANVDLALNGARAQGRGVIRPFADKPLGDTRIAIHALDLAAFSAGLPQTAIDADLAVTPDGSGRIELHNAAAGLYDQHKLPLDSLRADIAQREGKFVFDGIAASLGTHKESAGTVKGGGRYADGGLSLALALDNVDLHRLDGRARTTHLAGKVELQHAAGKQHFSVDLTEPFGKRHIALAAAGTLGDTLLAVERADLRLGNGRLHAAGKVELAERQAFALEGELQHLQSKEFVQFANLPAFDLNGKFSLHGTRSPNLDADVVFHIGDSQLTGRRLNGDGEARLHGDRLVVPTLVLAAGDNRLEAHGELSNGNGQLAFALTAPKLEQLGAEFGGAFTANGTARGTIAQPRIIVDWHGEQLVLPQQIKLAATEGKADVTIARRKTAYVERASVDGSVRELKAPSLQIASSALHLQFGSKADAPLALDLRAEGIATSQFQATIFTANAQGTTANHRLHAQLAESGRDQRWAIDTTGGLRDTDHLPRWQGTIDRLDAAGRFTAHLAAPASLGISKERFALEQFRLDANTASVTVERFVRDVHGIVTRGRIDRLQLAELMKYAEQPPPVSSDLVLDGDWDVSIAHSVSGSVNLRRTSGDIAMRNGTSVVLGLNRLEAHAVARNGMLNLQFNADGRQLGHIELSAATDTASGDKRFSIAQDAPITGTARIDIPSLAWAGPMINATAVTAGRLQSEIAVKGTLAQPHIAGRIAGSNLRLYLGDSGVDLRQGVLDGEFENDTFNLRQLAFGSNGGNDGNGGKLSVSGPVAFAGGKPDAQLSLQAQRFMLLNRSDRKLTLSGTGKLAWADGRAKATGAFAIDSGDIDIGREDMPQLSDDVVIVGREQKQSGGTKASVDIGVDLGSRLALHGRGLDATLAGHVRLTAEPGTPLRAQGTVSVAKGTYTAYGRKLAIEQGVLRFSGAINNPALDILAMRRGEGQDVEAGVAVRGTVLAPRVTLVSEPAVPEAEKLSWLVLGHGLDTAGTTDLGALQSAAGALLSQGAASTVSSHIATAFGLDDFKIATSQDNLQQRIVTLGKRLSSRLYVSYEQSLQTATSVVLLRYALSDRLTVEAEAGTRGALSLLYNFMFD
jgi:translocation and assembly module TamB